MQNTRAARIDDNSNEHRLGSRSSTGKRSAATGTRASPTTAIAQRWRPFEQSGLDVTCAEFTLGALPPRTWSARRAMLPISCYWGRGADGRSCVALTGAWRYPIGGEAERSGGFLCARWSTRLLLIAPTLLESSGSRIRGSAPHNGATALSVVDEGRHSTAFHSLFETLRFDSKHDGGAAIATAAIVRFIEEHCRLARTSASPDAHITNSVERSREFLIARVADGFELDDLAAVSNLSKCHLLRLFEREMGMTPRTFQLQLRLMSTLAMIAVGMSLSRATFDLGFADQSHLTRRFKEYLGLTPGSLQRLLATSKHEVKDEPTMLQLPMTAASTGSLEVEQAIESRSNVRKAINARVA